MPSDNKLSHFLLHQRMCKECLLVSTGLLTSHSASACTRLLRAHSRVCEVCAHTPHTLSRNKARLRASLLKEKTFEKPYSSVAFRYQYYQKQKLFTPKILLQSLPIALLHSRVFGIFLKRKRCVADCH